MKKVVIVQARMGSTRLGGKVMMDLAGKPVLLRGLERMARAALVDQVVVATTAHLRDDVIVELCRGEGWPVTRGDEDDVLSRYRDAALKFSADLVVRTTSDCPVSDPQLIDACIQRLLDGWREFDFVTNMYASTYPLGLAVECMPLDTLLRLDRVSDEARQREHVTSAAYRTDGLFRVDSVALDENLSHLRWTVDTAEDLEVVRRIFAHFGHDRFTWRQIVAAAQQHPEWATLNAHVVQKTG